ncbi:type III pantothenate kinase [Paraglaciecola psychrophila]|uniref:type III pantothenate kinase n=1 Tax=Paraglaciecola psychrophila TaxID=326544 RepID=UPI000291A6ED|nr:type III pantothenate kinase [Paraglaciecola psychrophila]GAC39907.1 type III pantothenate kinase [Paraglaciecola psychrophila 170]
MSDRSKALLVDIGNTQIKYALVSVISDVTAVNYCHQPEELAEFVRLADKVVVSSVGHLALVEDLKRLCEHLNTPCMVIKTAANSLGIQCAYEKYHTLGVDRWLAILAAREITQLPVAVIDLGTANTCDIVVNNKHIGGWIAPGFSVMRESLLNNTQQVFADTYIPDALDIGNTTEKCVSYGCLASQTGFVMLAEQFLANKYEDYFVLVTGGGQNSLVLGSSKKILFFPNLVLRGLFRLI